MPVGSTYIVQCSSTVWLACMYLAPEMHRRTLLVSLVFENALCTPSSKFLPSPVTWKTLSTYKISLYSPHSYFACHLTGNTKDWHIGSLGSFQPTTIRHLGEVLSSHRVWPVVKTRLLCSSELGYQGSSCGSVGNDISEWTPLRRTI